MNSITTLLFLIAASLAARAASFSTNPTADAFVTTGPSGNLVGNNYGAAGALALSAPGLPQGELQSVLQFNLGGALSSFNSTFGVGQWSIQSVTLLLTAAPANNTIFNPSSAGVFGISCCKGFSPPTAWRYSCKATRTCAGRSLSWKQVRRSF